VTADQPLPPPVRVRPVAAEGAESYIRRLARANHLKPSYLRRYLATPEGSYGPIHPDQLAAVPDAPSTPYSTLCPTSSHDNRAGNAPGKPRKTQSAATRHGNERCSPRSAGTQPQDYPGGRSNASTTSDAARWSRRWHPRPHPRARNPSARPPPTDFITTSTQ
jgi:hypothetical protein